MRLDGFQSLPQRGEIAFAGIEHAFLIGQDSPRPLQVASAQPFDAVLRLSPLAPVSNYSSDNILTAARRHNETVAAASLSSHMPFTLTEPLRYRGWGDLTGVLSEQADELPGAYPARSRITFTQLIAETGQSVSCDLLVDADVTANHADILFKQNRLATHLQLDASGLRTVHFMLEATPGEVQDFMKASLRHYTGTLALRRKRFLDLDWLYTAANLVYHQQFGSDAVTGVKHALPDKARKRRSAHLLLGSADSHPAIEIAVPATRNGNPEPVRAVLRTNELVEIHIHPDAGLMPLRHNVLMLGALLMRPTNFYPHFLDLMGPALL